jgi:hypothetical protein
MATGLAPSCPETGLGTGRGPWRAGPHEQAQLCLRMTGEALGQAGPSLEYVIRTRMYLTGTQR